MNRLPSLSQLHSRRLVALSLLSPLLACTSKNRFSLATLAGHSNIDKPAVNQFLIQYFIN